MNLGTKLIVSLVTVIILMMVHGYLSIEQDRENIERELTVGMRGFPGFYKQDCAARLPTSLTSRKHTQFIDAAAPGEISTG